MKMKYAFLDLFCGAGGTSTGINNIPGAFVFACINHDKNAIESHKSNHPEALHYIEDIRTVSIQKVLEKANEVRAKYPGIKICLWASLECTNHSNAKGGMSRDADSRTLAEHLFRYFVIDFDLIFIENVKEFKEWGPLRIKAIEHAEYSELVMTKPTKKHPEPRYVMIPDKRFKGDDYKKWIENVNANGYTSNDIIINCADIGCPTSRKRLFIQFAKPGYKIGWPKNTHAKNGINGLKEQLPVGPLLKLEEFGESIFTRTKALAENTFKRVHKGVLKFGIQPFITKYYGNGDNVASIKDPCPTLTVKDRCYLTKSFMISEYSTGRYNKITDPAPAFTTVPKQKYVTTFLSSQYGKSIGKSIKEPAPALTANPKENLISTHFLMDHQFNNGASSLHDPCPTLIARQDKKPKYLVSAQYLMSTNFNNIGSSLDEPAPTQLASRKHDYLVTTDETGENKSIIQEGDCDAVIGLKMFMQEHGIADIKMRALYISEMLKIMTFPEGYILKGSKTEQKKYIGNAVPPLAAEKIVAQSMFLNN